MSTQALTAAAVVMAVSLVLGGWAGARGDTLGGATPATRDSLVQLADLVDRGKFAVAQALARRTLASLRGATPIDSVALASVMDLQLQALIRSGVRSRTEWFEIAREALTVREHCLPPDDSSIATSLNRLANLLADNARYDEAEPLYRRALAIREARLGPDHPEVAELLLNLAMLHRNRGNWSEAHPLYRRAMTIWDHAVGAQFPFLSQSVNSLVVGLWSSGDYGEARMLSERLVAMWEKATSPDHPEVAFGLRAASGWMQGTGDWASAWPFLERALSMFEASMGRDHPDVAVSTNALAAIFMVTGEFALARKLYERSIGCWERGLGPEHPDVAFGLEGLGHLLGRTGDLAESRRVFERALEIREKAYGPDHPLVCVSLDQLAGIMIEMGDLQGARPLVERALRISERALGPNHPQVASELRAMARFPFVAGDFEGARRLLQRRLEIVERSIGPDQVETASALNNLAVVLSTMGDHRAARKLGERALVIKEQAFGPDHPDVAGVLAELAVEYQRTGDPDSARLMLERAVAIEEKTLGPDHPQLAYTLTLQAQLLQAAGRSKVAMDMALRAERIGREHFRSTALVLPERQALAFGAVRPSGLAVALLQLPELQDRDSRRKVIDAVVRSRALVLDEMAARHQTLNQSNDPEIEHSMSAFKESSTRYATLLARGPEPVQPERYLPQLEHARQAVDSTERELSAKSAVFRREQLKRGIGLAEVAAALPPRSALIGFAVYPVGLPRITDLPELSYVAYVLQGIDRIAVVPLGTVRTLDSLIGRWSDEAGNRETPGRREHGERAYRQSGEALRRRLWDPLVPFLADVERVFVVPDGAVNLVNLATLPIDHDQYLVERGPLIHYLSAERDLVTLESSREEGSGLLAMGGAAFEEWPGAVASNDRTAKNADAVAMRSAVTYRGKHSECEEFATLRFPALPGTLTEVREIGRLWSAAGRTTVAGDSSAAAESGPVLELTGVLASEPAFKRSAPGRAALHLATHGFFINGSCPSINKARERQLRKGGESVGSQSITTPQENPLRLSGLVLAGANHRAQAKPEEDDGILTAEEIASLNLTGVRWAVLSACETGVGNVRAGEGVLGLRRAFQVAGVRTLIMSLWAVEDAPTQRWVRAFYEARLGRGLNTAEAMRAASLEVLNERRGRRQSTHPATWGAFIAAGDWR